MSDALTEQLQASLGTAYTIERELGGGGMSRVFVAREEALGRDVVVKVLAPELAQGLSAERFAREIKLAAALQEPHIVPVLAAGVTTDGLPFYTMPWVRGESLRAQLARGPVSLAESVAILRDVATALEYAHAHGVVHRDIKPENVLLSGRTAVVTDFGIAKALSVSKTQAPDGSAVGTLTQLGTSLGTPAYMAPEQAAGDDVDARADLYAWGVMAYELFTGRHPFAGRTTAQQLIAAHIAEVPRPLGQIAPAIPPLLAALVMRCLAKSPDARPANAEALLTALEAPTGEASPSAPMSLSRALALYLVGAVVVLGVARLTMLGVGLPSWAFPATVAALALALPALLLTGWVQALARRAALAPRASQGGSTPSYSTLATFAVRASPVLTWRRTVRAVTAALVLLVLVVAAWLAARALGIGPSGSLLAAGLVASDAPVLVADFRSVGDTSLGPVVAEAVKTDLRQSNAVAVVGESRVADALQRMRLPRDARVPLDRARELARREGIPLVIDGEVRELGRGYAVTLRLVPADSGDPLASYQAVVDGPSQLIAAVGELSHQLRARIGESLRRVQQAPALDRATTSSLAALRAYTEGMQALYRLGERPTYYRRMHEAIALDSSFAMPYASLAFEYNNAGGQADEAAHMADAAYRLRDRLPPFERGVAIAAYFYNGPPAVRDIRRVDSATLLMAASDNPHEAAQGLNDQGWFLYATGGNLAVAESLTIRGLALDSANVAGWLFGNLVTYQTARGRFAAADSTLARMDRLSHGDNQFVANAAAVAFTRSRFDESHRLFTTLFARAHPDPYMREVAASGLAATSGIGGRLAEQAKWLDSASTAAESRGAAGARLAAATLRSRTVAIALGEGPAAARLLDSALAATPLDHIPPLDRPYADLAAAYSAAGRPDRARAYLAPLAQQTPGERDVRFGASLFLANAAVALADHRWDDALHQLRRPAFGQGQYTWDLLRGLAYDGAGKRDSAVAALERFVSSTDRYADADGADGYALVPAWRRLGELYEAKGDVPNALRAYQHVLDLWRGADPALQPQVQEVRRRSAALARQERGAR